MFLFAKVFATLATLDTLFFHCNFAVSKAMNNDIAQTIRQTKCAIVGRNGESRNN